MAKSKDEILYGAAQAKVSEDDALRLGYKTGTPLKGGKIADSEPVELFSSARKIEAAKQQEEPRKGSRQQAADEAGSKAEPTEPRRTA